MKKWLLIIIAVCLSSCTSLNFQEKSTLRSFQAHGISVDTPAGPWERPANPAGAGALNLFFGAGNFYLAAGNAGQSEQYVYGFLNLLTWPLSIIWGIPEAAIDANRINEKELVYFYTFDEAGRQSLADRGLRLNERGQLEKVGKTKE